MSCRTQGDAFLDITDEQLAQKAQTGDRGDGDTGGVEDRWGGEGFDYGGFDGDEVEKSDADADANLP